MNWMKSNVFNRFIFFCRRGRINPFEADAAVVVAFLKVSDFIWGVELTRLVLQQFINEL
jgi:hypothetical protein